MKTYRYFGLILFLTALLLSTYIIFTFGRIPQTDETFFKGAGLSWANGGPWAVTEFKGYFAHLGCKDLDEVFFSYPPGYSFLFGLFVKFTGLSWLSCALYDFLIHLLLLFVCVVFFKHVSSSTNLHAWLLACLMVFFGHSGRPDELAMVFGYLGILLCMVSSKPGSDWIRWGGYVSFGLCGAVSVPCLIIIGSIYAGHLLFSSASLLQKLIRGLQLSTVVIAVWFLAASPILLNYSGALNQNIATTFAHVGRDFSASFEVLIGYYRTDFLTLVLLLFFGLVSCPKNINKRHWQHWCQWWLAPLGVYILFFTKNTFQGSYYIFWMPWLLAAPFAWNERLSISEKKVRAPGYSAQWGKLAFISLVMAYPNVYNAKSLLTVLSTPKEQRWSNECPIIKQLIPAGARVLTYDHWWTVGDYTKVRGNFISELISPDEVDYVILTSQGSGTPGLARPLSKEFEAAFKDGRFEVIRNNLDSKLPTFMGIPLSNSAWGAGAIVYKSTRLE